MKLFLLSDNVDTLTGFRLAGVKGRIAHTKEEGIQGLHSALSDKEIGILLITEKLAKK